MNQTIRYLTVAAVNKYLQYKIDSDGNLKNIYLKAEISNARISKGILYFVLKDEESEMEAIMFASDLMKLKFEVKDGMKVVAFGSIKSYPKRGRYSFICSNLEDDGLGKAYQEFLLLKEKLQKEGLFDQSHKKKIPEYAERIGVITSKTGEAINDIRFTINNRFPLATIYLYPAIVQGSDAPSSLIKALKKVISDNMVDFIIIGRGGGSFEDLSCFNDEVLARAIYACPIPIISAVGHEGDFTICDFVSDLRAPTPTGAAMLSTIAKTDILESLNKDENRMISAIRNIIASLNQKHVNSLNSLSLSSPINKINNLGENLTNLNKRLSLINLEAKINDLDSDINNLLKTMGITLSHRLEVLDKELNTFIDKLILTNPLNLLKKGYSVVYKDNSLVSSVNQVDDGESINIKVSDGEFSAIVKKE